MPGRSAPGARCGAPVALAFDTAGSACSVAVGRGDRVLAHERREMRHGHAEALLPMIDRVTATAGLAASDLEIVVVSTGPGGFTGIRAGLAAAHGLALGATARLIGVTSFAAVAAEGRSPLLVALDSRRADFYVQLFDPAGEPVGEPAAVLPEDLSRHVASAIGETAALRVAGDAAANASAALAGRRGIEIAPASAPDALGVLAAARRRGWKDGAAQPLYLRPPDVSFPKPRRIAAGSP